MQDISHLPVMADEVIRYLQPKQGSLYVDATFGGGGHSALILDRSSPNGRLIAIDKDIEAIERGRRFLKAFAGRVELVKGDFRDVKEIVEGTGSAQVDGIIADIGVSSYQIDRAERGFSFSKDARVDMRMDREQTLSAFDLVNTLEAKELQDIFSRYGQERFSATIARRIVASRATAPIETTLELRELIVKSMPAKFRHGNIDPATRVFQALRIAVNDELGALSDFIKGAVELLRPGARLIIISFHSLEDRIVKMAYRQAARDCICPPRIPACVCGHKRTLKLITKKAVTAGDEEVARNPRARSAKLRVAQRL